MEGLLALGFLAFLGIYVMTSKPTAADRREAREDELAIFQSTHPCRMRLGSSRYLSFLQQNDSDGNRGRVYLLRGSGWIARNS